MIRYLLIFLIMTGSVYGVTNQSYGPADTSANATTLGTDTTCRLQKFYMVHDAAIDTLEVCWKYVDAGDKIYGIIYSLDPNGHPKTQLGRTNDSAADAGKVKLTFASSISLSENTAYAVGVEVIDGDASTHNPNYHKDTLEFRGYYQFLGELPNPWDTANDSWNTDVGMPYWRLVGATTNAYDTTARDSSYDVTKDNDLQAGLLAYPNNGTASTIMIGLDDNIVSGWIRIGIFSVEDATETYMTSFFADTADIMIYDSFYLDYNDNNNLTTDDTFDIFALKCDSSGTSIQFSELGSDWDTLRGNGSNHALWTSDGGQGLGTDIYNLVLGTFVVDDTNAAGFYAFGFDTLSYNNFRLRADSLKMGAWVDRGFLVKCRSGDCGSKNDNLIVSSGESATKPIRKYKVLALVEQTAASAETTNRHAGDNRHGAIKH